MATLCNAKSGCGNVSLQPKPIDNHDINFVPAPIITYPQMTNCTNHPYTPQQMPGTSNSPTKQRKDATTEPDPGTQAVNQSGAETQAPSIIPAAEGSFETIPGQPDPPALFTNANADTGRVTSSSATGSTQTPSSSSVPPSILPEAPQFQVPNNPLLPPGYQETIDYENLQYLNGFLRTQIGKYMRVEQLVGSSNVEDRYGYLIGVGVNYILLQEIGTGNVSAIDYYNIKYVYIYYATPQLPYFR